MRALLHAEALADVTLRAHDGAAASVENALSAACAQLALPPQRRSYGAMERHAVLLRTRCHN